jgi:hypothetical protein
MKFSLSPARLALGLGFLVALLAGCRSGRPTASIGVSSPPAPLIGSTPIAAYDDYARGVAPATKIHIESVAQVDSP